MGSVFGKESSSEGAGASAKLEEKMREAMQIRARSGTKIKSFNQVIMQLPRIGQALKNCMKIFEEFDKDSNGLIEKEELKILLEKLGILLNEQEMNEVFQACDLKDRAGLKFNEFLVLLCLVYLLQKPSPDQAKSVSGLSELEKAFELLVDSFVLMDKDGDGYVNKEETLRALSESDHYDSSSPDSEALKIFEEMDCDHNGMVSFREFVFACIRWVGLVEDDEDDEEIDPDELR